MNCPVDFITGSQTIFAMILVELNDGRIIVANSCHSMFIARIMQKYHDYWTRMSMYIYAIGLYLKQHAT